MIIGFGGKKCSGKDTVANFLVKNHNFKRYAFADPVKEISKILFNLSDDQLNGNLKDIIDENLGISPREIFQKIGTEFGQYYIHELLPNLNIEKRSIWITLFKQFAKTSESNIVISDVRFLKEIEVIKELNGVVIYIDRTSTVSDEHPSETLSSEYFDKVIINDSTIESLENKLNYEFIF
jgi:dephospho-CoA kinase